MKQNSTDNGEGRAIESYRAAEREFRELMFYGQKLSKREMTMLSLKLDELLDASMIYHQQIGREQSKK